MAALDFPLVPNTDSEVTTGDITWKWNGYAWYAASQGDDVYLSKVTDDEAAGAITFKALTTHEAGVKVTGGDLDAVNTGLYTTSGTNVRVAADGNFVGQFNPNGVGLGGAIDTNSNVHITQAGFTNKDKQNALQISKSGNGSGTNMIGVNIVLTPDDNATANVKGFQVRPPVAAQGRTIGGEVYGYSADVNLSYFQGTADQNTFGFYSGVIEGGNDRKNWNFYAAGNAPNYFNGGVQFDLTHSQGGTQDQLLLNKYEEGTFTTASTDSALDSFTKDGLSYYQLVGKTVTYAVRIGLNSDGAKTLPAGTYNITGFPFTNVAANSGGVVTFIGTSNSFKSETNASFVSNGPTLRFVVDSNINNVTLIRCTFTVFLT